MESERVEAGRPQVEYEFASKPSIAEVEAIVRRIVAENPRHQVEGIEVSNAIKLLGLNEIDGVKVDVDQRYFGFDAVRVVFKAAS